MKERRTAKSHRHISVFFSLLLALPRLLYPQSPQQLLQDTAKNYQTLTGAELSGHVTAAIPGSVWQFKGDFTLIGSHTEPSPDGGPPKIVRGGNRISGMRSIKTVADSPEPMPTGFSFPLALLMQFGTKISDNVVVVERSGSETLQLNGEAVACDTLKVTYTPSTYDHPHPEAVTYWISPAKHLVLKEVLTFNAGRVIQNALWTITFDSIKFDRPTPDWVLNMANIPDVKERREWIGRVAPAFKLPASDGSPVTLESLKGKAVLLSFWSVHCGPCLLEMPMLEDVSREYGPKGIVLLGISIDPSDKSKEWLVKNNRTLRTLTDADYVASNAYQVHGIPVLVLIGPDGQVKEYWQGPVSKETIEAALNAPLKERKLLSN